MGVTVGYRQERYPTATCHYANWVRAGVMTDHKLPQKQSGTIHIRITNRERVNPPGGWASTTAESVVFSAARWRRRALEMRAAANEAEENKERFHKLAADFEQLAERAAAM